MKLFTNLLALVIGTSSSSVVFADTKDFVIIDVRTASEYGSSHVQGALNMDVLQNDFTSKISKLDKSKTYKLYCRSGNRSGRAMQMMKSLGFTDVENLGSLGQAAKRLQRPLGG